MKKINDLRSERAEIISKMEEISLREVLTDEQRQAWNENDVKVKAIDNEIAMLERQDELNKSKIEKMENRADNTVQPLGVQFRDWLKDAVDGKAKNGFVLEQRADPILQSTDSGIINKAINPAGIDVLTSPGEAWLRQLGVTFFPGLVGNFTLPSMGEATAGFVDEAADGSTAGMASASVTLAARRVTNSQAITVETLAQTNPAVYTTILNNLVTGVWNAVAKDYFTQVLADSAGQRTTPTAAGLVYGDLLQMEASIGHLVGDNAKYVTTPNGKAYMKSKLAYGTTAAPALWVDNEVNGYPAMSTPHLGAGKIAFGDFSKTAIGQWGGLEIIVDPYTAAKSGKITLTVTGLFDAGCINKRGIVFADASMAT